MSDFNMNEMGDHNPHTGGQQKLDAGDYNVMISEASLETNKKKTGTNLVMEYTVLDGQFSGVTVKEWLCVVNASEQTQNIARSQLQAIRVLTGTQNEGDVQVLKGKSIRIRVTKEPNEYVDNNGNKRTGYNNNVVLYMSLDGKNAEGKQVPEFVPSEAPPSSTANTTVQGSGGSQSGQTDTQASGDLDDEIPF